MRGHQPPPHRAIARPRGLRAQRRGTSAGTTGPSSRRKDTSARILQVSRARPIEGGVPLSRSAAKRAARIARPLNARSLDDSPIARTVSGRGAPHPRQPPPQLARPNPARSPSPPPSSGATSSAPAAGAPVSGATSSSGTFFFRHHFFFDFRGQFDAAFFAHSSRRAGAARRWVGALGLRCTFRSRRRRRRSGILPAPGPLWSPASRALRVLRVRRRV